jgi:uncharacterized protein YdeI (YjbR/CyaY-like superfamily)
MTDLAKLVEISTTTRAYLNRMEHLSHEALQQAPLATDSDAPTELQKSIAAVHKDVWALMTSIDRLWEAID